MNNKLAIIWTTFEEEVFNKLVYMYALTSKKRGWWDDVILIIWGPSQKPAAKNEGVNKKLTEMINNDVKIKFCRRCAEEYDLVEKLEKRGMVLEYMGASLTEYLKNGYKVLTF
jgi:hypothetical protein